MTNGMKISAVINVRNEAEKLPKCLKSLQRFANEIIVIDMHSTDGSGQIARDFGATVYSYRWLRAVEPARNFGLSRAGGQWIILLDPDEYLNRALKQELVSIIARTDVDFVKIPRKNIIFGKWLRHGNCWPDYLIRFFKKGAVTWKKEIHSQPDTKGNGLTLLDSEKLAIRHLNYTTTTQFVLRAIRYAGVQAEELRASGYKLKISDLLLRPIQEFNSRFFAAEGYKDGLHGLIFSLLQGFAVGLVYVRLWEKDNSVEKSLSKTSFVSASQESTFEYSYWFTRYFVREYTKNPLKTLLIKLRYLLNRLTKNF